MDFEEYKKQFDESFSKVDPKSFIEELIKLGYKFDELVKSTPNDQELGEKIRKLLNEQNTI